MADFIWTSPKEFEDTQNVNKSVLNTYLSENDRYLFRRPRDLISLEDVGTFSTTSTSLVAISTSQLRLNITLQAVADLMFHFNGSFDFSASNARKLIFDIQKNGSDYLSSNDPTALSHGLHRDSQGANNNGVVFNTGFVFVLPSVAVGTYFFDLHWAVDSATVTLHTNPKLQFGVREV